MVVGRRTSATGEVLLTTRAPTATRTCDDVREDPERAALPALLTTPLRRLVDPKGTPTVASIKTRLRTFKPASSAYNVLNYPRLRANAAAVQGARIAKERRCADLTPGSRSVPR